MLARQGIKATINVSGIMAERYPDTVRMIVERGHEVVAHSYAMDIVPIYLSEDEERANIARTTELIARATGVTPRGWISPRSTPSARTPRLWRKPATPGTATRSTTICPIWSSFRNARSSPFPTTPRSTICRITCATAMRRVR